MHPIEDFHGKAALITGGADGIGLALAEALTQAGARVFLTDIAENKLKDAADRLGAASAPCDVSEQEAVAEVVERAWSEIGPIDLLCANAGVIVPGSVLTTSQADRDFIFGVNVWGIVNAVRPFAAKLRSEGRGGYVLLTGSEHSLSSPEYLRPVPMHLYNMTKHAVLSLGEALRAELGPDGVGVSVLCPGPVESGLATNSGENRPTRFGGPQPVELEGMDTLDPQVLQSIGELYMPASRAAQIALNGIAHGAFIIPTHAFEQRDLEARHREALAGFDLLGALPDE